MKNKKIQQCIRFNIVSLKQRRNKWDKNEERILVKTKAYSYEVFYTKIYAKKTQENLLGGT